MKTLAIIGTGIAGMSCAHFLKSHYDLTVYERNDYAGGHTNTVTIEENGRSIPVDTGFMVYNEATYPQLTRLFADLEVETQLAAMSFSVQYEPARLEFSGSGISGLFAQRRNLFKPSYWRFLREIDRFNRESVRLLEDPNSAALTLAQYADQHKFSKAFLDQYLVPMSSAVWSTPPDEMLRFPAVTLIRFFKNHGFLGLHTQHPWRTVRGGTRVYRDKILAPLRERLRLKSAAVRVTRTPGGVDVSDVNGRTQHFDEVIVACHADEAIALLASPTIEEKQLLGSFRYQRNIVTVHTDGRVMPRERRAWSAWNYRVARDRAGKIRPSTIYYMNRLQSLACEKNYFVSINDFGEVNPSFILKTIEYYHPLFTVEAIRAQESLPVINRHGPVYFCGSYFRYGFHEDALMAGLAVVDKLLPWNATERPEFSARLLGRAA